MVHRRRKWRDIVGFCKHCRTLHTVLLQTTRNERQNDEKDVAHCRSGVLVGVVALIVVFLPQILSLDWISSATTIEWNTISRGRRALIIATNHDTLGDPEDGVATGVYGSELTIAYYEFLDAGMTVDIASIEGGEIPFEPVSLRWPLATHADRRFLDDEDAQNKTHNSLSIDDVDFLDYDIIWHGGWLGCSLRPRLQRTCWVRRSQKPMPKTSCWVRCVMARSAS